MEESELFVSGIGVSAGVVSAIVSRAAQRVEGVAAIGPTMTSSLVSVFTGATVAGPVVEAEVIDGKLCVTIHLSVFFGYKLTDLADAVRAAVAQAIFEQVGVEAGAVNICIDGLVFPKE